MKKEYVEELATRLIEQIKSNTAPWQKPWKPGEINKSFPHNATTGNAYKGMNLINLMSKAEIKGYNDPRWLTYNQAVKNFDAQVRKGEKGTQVHYWKFSEERIKKDEKGKPILDEKGKPKKEIIKLDRPQVFFSVVFNAEQIDGMPPLEQTVKKVEEWERQQQAENILKNSGVSIRHIGGDRAYYSPLSDQITLPERPQFESADKYYATALHELGHATGHHTRLDRDLTGGFGSESYAKEELRAEIASMFIGQELQIGHDPGQHIAYLQSWVKVLEDDPKEIFRAARDADQIMSFVLDLNQEKTLENTESFFKSLDESALQLKPSLAYQSLLDITKDLGCDIAITTNKNKVTANIQVGEKSDFDITFNKSGGIVISDLAKKPLINHFTSNEDFNSALKKTIQAIQVVTIDRENNSSSQFENQKMIDNEQEAIKNTFSTLQNHAEKLGYTAQVLPNHNDEQKNYLVEYYAGERKTDVTSNILESGKAMTFVDGEPLANTNYTSDQNWQEEGLTQSLYQDFVTEVSLRKSKSNDSLSMNDNKLVEAANKIVLLSQKNDYFKFEVGQQFKGQIIDDLIEESKDQDIVGIALPKNQDENMILSRVGNLYNITVLDSSNNKVSETEPVLKEIALKTFFQNVDFEETINKFTEKPTKILLDVPFSEKNEAREAGAKWDKNEKSWYIMSDQLDLAHNKWIKTDSEDKQNLETMDNVSTKEEKTYINVPFSEKSEAKEAGAMWDKNEKSWFIPENVNTAPFEKWLPKDENHAHTAKLSSDESNFLKELAEAQGYENVGYLILYSVNQKEVGSFTPVSELQSDQEIEEASKHILNMIETGNILQENRYIADTITDLKDKYHFNEMYVNEDSIHSNETSNEVKEVKVENNSEIKAAKEKTYINVPFSEKNEAKEAGAMWDKNEKSWFIPENVNTAPFEKWIEVRDSTTEAIKDITSIAQEELSKSLQPSFSDAKIFLAVAYEDREDAKEAGAKWDKEAKCWYAPEGSDMMLLNKWLPENQANVDSYAHANNTPSFQTDVDPILQFRQALQSAGLNVDNPQMDGKLHRVKVDGDKGSKKSGAYKGNLNGIVPSGFIQNFKTGLKENWKASGKIQGTVDTAKLQAEAAQRNYASTKKREAMYEQVAHKAELLISHAEPLVSHKYLDKKQVGSHGLLAVPGPNPELEAQGIFIGNTYKETKQLRDANKNPEAVFLTKNDVMIPCRDIEGKVWTVQAISENGFKSWLKGGKKQGNFFTIGDFENGKPILEVEGYATGATLHEVTGRPVAVSFDSGNLTSIAMILKEQFKDSIIYVAGDNDIESFEKNENMLENVGVEKAKEAANAVNGHIIIPKVKIGDDSSDWNDIAVKKGNQHVKAEIKSILESINQKQEQKQESISLNENIHKLQREASNIKNKQESKARSISR